MFAGVAALLCKHLLPCPGFKEAQVCDANECGLDSVLFTLRYLLLPPFALLLAASRLCDPSRHLRHTGESQALRRG